MRISIYGYGRMGRTIEDAAQKQGHTIVQRITSENAGEAPVETDVVIEFSRPDQALKNMKLCLENSTPIVVGTTGWYDQLYVVKDLVAEHRGALLYASNFSIGVNLFFRVNKALSMLMDKQQQYRAELQEVHHEQKLDAPSGTAITLARDLILQVERYKSHTLAQAVKEGELPVTSIREGDVPGTHSVRWTSAEDRIVIEHAAFGRAGFAKGAIAAAEWLVALQPDGKKRTGLFTFDDVIDPQ